MQRAAANDRADRCSNQETKRTSTELHVFSRSWPQKVCHPLNGKSTMAVNSRFNSMHFFFVAMQFQTFPSRYFVFRSSFRIFFSCWLLLDRFQIQSAGDLERKHTVSVCMHEFRVASRCILSGIARGAATVHFLLGKSKSFVRATTMTRCSNEFSELENRGFLLLQYPSTCPVALH